jgi:hypothetical protein
MAAPAASCCFFALFCAYTGFQGQRWLLHVLPYRFMSCSMNADPNQSQLARARSECFRYCDWMDVLAVSLRVGFLRWVAMKRAFTLAHSKQRHMFPYHVLPNSSAQIRQKNEDLIEIHISLWTWGLEWAFINSETWIYNGKTMSNRLQAKTQYASGTCSNSLITTPSHTRQIGTQVTV